MFEIYRRIHRRSKEKTKKHTKLFTEIENKHKGIKEQIQQYWHKTNNQKNNPTNINRYAVDGSLATRQFSNGSELLITQSLMIGKNKEGKEQEHKEIFLNVHRGPGNPNFSAQYGNLIRSIVETDTLARDIIKSNEENRYQIVLEEGLDEDLGCQYFEFDGERIPIFFSGNLTGQRALDKGSRQRLKWQIDKILEQKT